MENVNVIADRLKIHSKCIKIISKTRVVCLVSTEWLHKEIKNGLTEVCHLDHLSSAEIEKCLAPSNTNLPQGLTRISVKILTKSDQLITRLPDASLDTTAEQNDVQAHLAEISRDNYQRIWSTYHRKYSHSQVPTSCPSKQKMTDVLMEHLHRLHPDIIQHLNEDENEKQQQQCVVLYRQNIMPILFKRETAEFILLVEPYMSCTVHNALAYSSAISGLSFAKPLFILYQILHTCCTFHRLGLSIGNLNLNNVMIDEKLWVYVSNINRKWFDIQCHCIKDKEFSGKSAVEKNPSENDMKSANTHAEKKNVKASLLSRNLVESDSLVRDAKLFLKSCQEGHYEVKDLIEITDAWCKRKISNFRYIMILNFMAGRRIGDPNHHPVIPWVMDFTGPDTGFRDLSMSKFRLNKGDNQLDLTYETFSSMTDSSHIPHHVSDVLSDITYYVYKARITSKSILCAHVRSKWVPNEYPSSMLRMQEWTPDECIPEFYTDPKIFTSIHEDLPDLELPPWCSGAEDFISKHMAVLESDSVSEGLHHWIDLTFGYKLTGKAAALSKNINLRLVDNHKQVLSHGVVQLFTHPHPHRTPPAQVASLLPPRVPKNMLYPKAVETQEDPERRPETAIIQLPKGYNPLSDLNHLEDHYTFSSHVMAALPKSAKNEVPEFIESYKCQMLTRDLQVLGCFGCELFLTSRLQMQERNVGLHQRYQTICKLHREKMYCLPRPIQNFAQTLLFSASSLKQEKLKEKDRASHLLFEYPAISSSGLPLPTPNLLLNPHSDILFFPKYFAELYTCLCNMKEKDNMVNQIRWRSSKSHSEKEKVIKVIVRDKVTLLQTFLEKYQGKINNEGMEIILPYVEELFSCEDTSVQAAWSLLNLIGQEIGPSETTSRFLPHLTKLFSGESSTPKHMKIYHRTFLVQLLLRLGLQTFLSNFTTLLVEAVAGYKDYIFEDLFLETTEIKEMCRTQNCSIQGPEESALPPLVEENHLEDQEEQPVMQNTCTEKYPDSSIKETTESTQDDIDEIEDDILDDVSCSNGEKSDPDAESIGSYNPNDDAISSKSDRSEDSPSIRSDSENLTQNVDGESLTSFGGVIEMASEPTDSVNDVENGSWSENMEQSSRTESLQFQSQDEADEFEESQPAEESSRPDDLNVRSTSSASNSKIFSPIGLKGMVRSETDEFAKTMSDKTAEEVVNIKSVATESIKWLSVRLGPLLTAKFLSRNLIRMLALCYLGEEQLISIGDPDKKLPKTSRLICGDRNANKIIECLSHIARLYGEQVVILQYIPSSIDMLNVAKKRLTQRAEAGLISAMVLLRHILPLVSDKTLMDILQDTLINEILLPAIKLLSSPALAFPGGSTVRTISAHKLIDVIYVIGLRLGFEMTRTQLTVVLKTFFSSFNDVHGIPATLHKSSSGNKLLDSDKFQGTVRSQGSNDESYCNIKMDSSTKEVMIGTPVSVFSAGSFSPHSPTAWNARKSHSLTNTLDDRDENLDTSGRDRENGVLELENVFTPELAYASYIPFCRIFGSIHMEQNVPNEDMIRRLCAQYDINFDVDSSEDGSAPQSPIPEDPNRFPPDVQVTGNKIYVPVDSTGPDFIKFGPIHRSSRILKLDPDEVKCDMKSKSRHLRGNWLLYWEHELGLSERDTLFNFKQIKLHTFEGHTNSIRSLKVLDNENSFISASKDKTVKLWSIKSFGDGNGRSKCQMTYTQHKKSIFSVVYLESVRLVASCDSTIHIWDPFTSEVLCQLDSSKYAPVTALAELPSPSAHIIAATSDATLKYVDLRAAKYAHEFRSTALSAGLIRSITAGPGGDWIAVGFSTGYMSILDQRTGILLATWKGHEGEILQLKAYGRKSFISTSFDNTMKLWNVDDIKDTCILKGHTDPSHCVTVYKGQVISATTGNKIGVHSSADIQANFTLTKLRSDTFKGVLTSMAILPLNKSLLLGADNGSIKLLC